MQETNRNRFGAARRNGRGEPANRGFVERRAHAAVGADALRDRQPQRARHQRLGLVDQQIVLVVAVLVRHFERVTETLSGEEGDLGAAALDHGVGRERGSVHDHSDRIRRELSRAQQLRDAIEHGAFRRLRRGQKLEAELARSMLQHEIREGPADINSEPRFLHTAYKTWAGAGVKVGRSPDERSEMRGQS